MTAAKKFFLIPVYPGYDLTRTRLIQIIKNRHSLCCRQIKGGRRGRKGHRKVNIYFSELIYFYIFAPQINYRQQVKYSVSIYFSSSKEILQDISLYCNSVRKQFTDDREPSIFRPQFAICSLFVNIKLIKPTYRRIHSHVKDTPHPMNTPPLPRFEPATTKQRIGLYTPLAVINAVFQIFNFYTRLTLHFW